ncbi:hypothetical protein EI94DRAFT_916506 [Lactarius quietus]|nr:hypothetical protein EI94DRAFT_916506 [Lactarius quietus]
MTLITTIVDVLSTFSETLGGVSSLPFPPERAVFSGIEVLLAAAKDVNRSHHALVKLFERIQNVIKPLADYTQISLTTEMAELFVKTAAEVLSILSIATKEVMGKRERLYFGKLLGRRNIEDAFKRLNGLIQEQVRMAIDQTLKANIEHQAEIEQANGHIDNVLWNQIEEDVRKWFSPPDPSTNHHTACEAYNNVPPAWLFKADVFEDWMSNGSLLWVHGKPGSGKTILCSAIIQHITKIRHAGKATLAYFYFDFRDEEKQNVRNVLTSLLVQLSAYSEPCCDIIYRLYWTHGDGMQQPSNGILIDCLEEMLAIAVQHPIFIVMDALDECPDFGIPSPREAVLNLIKDLVHLHLHVPNLRICITSRSDVDIQTKLKPLAINVISLHDDSRQSLVISDYVSSAVSSDKQMKLWRDKNKKLVVKNLSERADGR